MNNKIIDGKKISKDILEELKQKISLIKGRKPKLVVILVGNDPASEVYVNKKIKISKRIGIISELIKLSDQVSEDELINIINKLNKDDGVDGILVQLPLPKQIDSAKVMNLIYPEKDVDGFHPDNVGNLFIGNEKIIACTPKGVMRCLEYYNINVTGKEVTMVGCSNIVGKPMTSMLLNRRATITICHSKTKNLAKHTKNADILIVAVGRPGMITSDMIKEGAVVIDVGTTRVDGKIKGDVDFENVIKKVSLITPVPGGIGPMTVAMLMENTLQAYEQRVKN